ncbi:MAG: 1-acyl-sn-glycerol-3-phosphate acyltransferase [Planctomycetes bacterium]|nr:1-acyl-sn-glycerol-3-phosphate acyltransferase [Planctomycetota bacterium]
MATKLAIHPLLIPIQRLMCLTVGLVVRTLYGLRAINVPRVEGALILAPNHTSFLDPILLQLALPKHVTFLMDGPIYRHPALNWFYRFWGAIPVPASRRAAAGAIKDAMRAADAGELIGIFPEGRISPDGKLGEGRAGVALLMQRTGVPVVPVAIFGAREVLPRQADFPRCGRFLVVFGEPIHLEDGAEDDRKETADRLKDEVMRGIADLQARWARYL